MKNLSHQCITDLTTATELEKKIALLRDEIQKKKAFADELPRPILELKLSNNNQVRRHQIAHYVLIPLILFAATLLLTGLFGITAMVIPGIAVGLLILSDCFAKHTILNAQDFIKTKSEELAALETELTHEPNLRVSPIILQTQSFSPVRVASTSSFGLFKTINTPDAAFDEEGKTKRLA